MKVPGWMKIIIGFVVAVSVTFFSLAVVGMAISIANKSPIDGEDIVFLVFGIMTAIQAFIAIKYRDKLLMMVIQETLGAPKGKRTETNFNTISGKILICIGIAISLLLIFLGFFVIPQAHDMAYLYENGWEVKGEIESFGVRSDSDGYTYYYHITYVNAKGENAIYNGYRINKNEKSDELGNDQIGKKISLYIDDRGGVCLTVKAEKLYKYRYVLPLTFLFVGIILLIGLSIFLVKMSRYKEPAPEEVEHS
jgi:hypothetical protein